MIPMNSFIEENLERCSTFLMTLAVILYSLCSSTSLGKWYKPSILKPTTSFSKERISRGGSFTRAVAVFS